MAYRQKNYLKISIIFWKEGAKDLAEDLNVPFLGEIPLVIHS
jgi:Mrp family chromosome partitioning ATPase